MSCVFCRIVRGQQEASRVYQDDRFLAFMDVFPARPGHVLVIPKPHAERLEALSDDTRRDLFLLGTQVGAALRNTPAIECADVHYLLNDGRAASQTVPHVHLHVVPRTGGDLWRVFAELLKRGAGPLNRQTPRSELDRLAATIEQSLTARTSRHVS